MSLYVILGRKVMVRRTIAGGESELLVGIYVVDEFFGDWALIDSINSDEQAIALEQETRVMSWTDTEIEELILRRPSVLSASLRDTWSTQTIPIVFLYNSWYAPIYHQ